MEEYDFEKTVHLVQAAQQGNRGALDDLFGRYLPQVCRIVAARLGEHMYRYFEVEDLAQEALLKAFRKFGEFEHRSEGGFRNWLARFVHNEIMAQVQKVRAKKRGGGKVLRFADFGTSALSSSLFACRARTPSSQVRGRETDKQVEQVLQTLPQRDRELLILRHFCDMTYGEIADTLGFRREDSARKACERALQKMQKKLSL